MSQKPDRDPSSDASAPVQSIAPAPLYTARVENIGGTEGEVRVDGGAAPSTRGPVLPTGGPFDPERGYNPEQFLAMAWSTCLGETLKVVLSARGLENLSRVRVEVDLHREKSGGYYFVPRAHIAIEGLDAEESRRFAEKAHARCPVSKLLSGKGSPTVEVEDY